MKKEIIQQLYSAFEQAALEVDGVECWSARELCTLLGYSQWRNFVGVIDKAKTACENVGHNVSDHFADVSKTINLSQTLCVDFLQSCILRARFFAKKEKKVKICI